MRPTKLLLGALFLYSACSPGSRTAGARNERSDSGEHADVVPVTPTEYATSMTFLSGSGTQLSGLVLQLANYATRSGLKRNYRGWLLERAGWQSVMNLEIQDGPTRAPWRIFPSPSLSLIVDSDGDTERLSIRSGRTGYSLEFGDLLDAWEDRAGTRHEIRISNLVRRGRAISGVLVQQRFAIPTPSLPTIFGAFERVVVTSEDGAILVFFNTRDPETYGEPFAWMYADGLTRRWPELETRTVEVVNSASLRRNIPVRTWFRIAEPDIKCELTAQAREVTEFDTDAGPKPYNALYRVSGWVEFAGERRRVQGIMERAEP